MKLDLATSDIQTHYCIRGDSYACRCGWRLPPVTPGHSRKDCQIAQAHHAKCRSGMPAQKLREVNIERYKRCRFNSAAAIPDKLAAYYWKRHDRLLQSLPTNVTKFACDSDPADERRKGNHRRYLCKRCKVYKIRADVWRTACKAVPAGPEDAADKTNFRLNAAATGLTAVRRKSTAKWRSGRVLRKRPAAASARS